MLSHDLNQVLSAGFATGAVCLRTRFRTFNVLDDFNREALAIEVDASLPSARLVLVVEQLKAERGLTNTLKFLGHCFTQWLSDMGLDVGM